MPLNFYSGTEDDLKVGSANLVTIVTPVPATWGLTSGQITSYNTLATTYATKLALTQVAGTKTKVTVAQKNEAKKALKLASVRMNRIISSIPTVTNDQLIELGLNPRATPGPRPFPTTPPTVEVISCAGRLVKIRIHDTSTESRGKPFGTTGANLFSYVGSSSPTDPALYHLEGTATRATIDVLFPDSVASGATIWLSACWINARGERGIGSTPISFTIQGGALPAAA